ncbi:MAG: fused MFS/spermidine synthase [Gaiellaceae bacterium]
MDARPSSRALAALVFGAGTGTLAVEISASRLLAPYYGSSTVVWANLIGLVLLALSLGYWLGGKLADRRPSGRLLGALVLGAGAFVAVLPFVTHPILDLAAEGLDELSAGAVIGSFFATLLLFAPPVFVLGMVSPFAIRLALESVGSAGEVAGRLYALSTAGSLLGTFLPALVTIPLVGTQRTLIGSAVVLASTSTALLGRRALVPALAIAALLALPPGVIKAVEGQILLERESRYQFVQVVERDGVRRLYLNEGIAVHSVYRPGTVLTGGIWDAFLAVPALLQREPRTLAVLGNAGGTIARAYGVHWPRVRIDGVEIDPEVSDAGLRYLGMGDNPRLRVVDADARPFLRRADRRYDLVFVDAYHQPYVPFYLATREFFELVRSRLAPGGLVALNVATVPGDRRLRDELAGTLAAVFPEVRIWPVLRFNHVVIGLTAPFAGVGGAPVLGDLLATQLTGPVGASDDPWTDDRAPVEWITDRMILSYAARGGDLDEEPLPTAP